MKTNILIIEDNDDIRESTAEVLELAGYHVLKANNGKSGVDLAQKSLPDLILCDIMMPELDGYGVLYLLSKQPETSSIPFIFLTAKAERIDLRRGMEMGADDYLTKPFDDLELLNAIESRLSKRDKQKAFYSKAFDSMNSLAGQVNGLDEFKKIIQERKTRHFKKKQVIYYEGDPASGIYLILYGKVKTIKMSIDGRELLTGMHGADDYLGAHALLSGSQFTDTAETLEDTEICLIPKEIIEELIHRYPDVSKQFIQILSQNLKDKEEQLLQLAYHSVRKRLSEVLLRLAKDANGADLDTIKISRDDLASMAGMATETVSRTLSDFKAEGLIEKQGSRIQILKSEQFKRMKN
jgi:CRP-like cAMP-binding protein/ActR/RegA family two-component response regulator